MVNTNQKIEVTELIVEKRATGQSRVAANEQAFLLVGAFRCKRSDEPLNFSSVEVVDLVFTKGCTEYRVVGAELGVIAVHGPDKDHPDGWCEGKFAGGQYQALTLAGQKLASL